jgi:hypothetical protein
MDDEAELFPSAVNPEMVRETLGEMQEVCQVLFEIYFDLGLCGGPPGFRA